MALDIRRITVIIPSYKPDEKLARTVSGLCDAGFTDILVVDDGGGEEFAPIFDSLAELPQCTVLRHPQNRGKGAALKTAFSFVADNRPSCEGVVTADGDGQHLPHDILNCAAMMADTGCAVLGSRDFSGSHVPKKSRMGNHITSFVFLAFCGLKISDTQTGLRAIPARFLRPLLEVEGDRYEYETNMLLAAKRLGMQMREEKIETVYLDGNQTSHFRAVRDSIRIYSLILKYVFSSFCSSLVDLLVFYLLTRFFGAGLGVWSVLVCTCGARLVSSVFNFTVNRHVVFRGGVRLLPTLLRYYALAIPTVACSTGLVSLLKWLLGVKYAIVVTIIKMFVDIFLFFVSFRVQREWVFKKALRKA